VRVSLNVNGEVVSENALHFERFKHLALPDPELEIKLEKGADRFILELTPARWAKSVCIRFPGVEVKLSDDYSDVWPKATRRVEVMSVEPLERLRKALKVRTLG